MKRLLKHTKHLNWLKLKIERLHLKAKRIGADPLFKYVIGVPLSLFYVYLYIPLMSLYIGYRQIKQCCTCSKTDPANLDHETSNESNEIDEVADEMAGKKVFEQIHEALPQLCLTAIFVGNHYKYLNEQESIIFDNLKTQTIVTLITSAISLVIGLCTGLLVLKQNENGKLIFRLMFISLLAGGYAGLWAYILVLIKPANFCGFVGNFCYFGANFA